MLRSPAAVRSVKRAPRTPSSTMSWAETCGSGRVAPQLAQW